MSDPRDEMNEVCRTAAEFALKQIGEHGEFIPFAVVILKDGELRLVSLGEDVVTDGGPTDLAQLHEVLQSGAKQALYRATAVASDTQFKIDDTGDTTDAVHVEVEHLEDEPISCILPYRRNTDGVEQHIDPFFQPGRSVVLSNSAP